MKAGVSSSVASFVVESAVVEFVVVVATVKVPGTAIPAVASTVWAVTTVLLMAEGLTGTGPALLIVESALEKGVVPGRAATAIKALSAKGYWAYAHITHDDVSLHTQIHSTALPQTYSFVGGAAT
jgi:hypothetical protein